MPAISIKKLGKGEPPLYDHPKVDRHFRDETLEFVVIEGGMASGAPSIIIRVPGGEDGDIIIETSLQALMAATRGLTTMAEVHFGWVQT